MLRRTVILLLLLCVGSARADAPVVSFIETAPGVRLEVLDFGGEGPDVLLLAGLGHTAHVWEPLAGKLTGQARVRAVTRRGYGDSSHVNSGYDARTLARDLLVVCDSLHIERVVLVGHSVAGSEMTRFAVTWPGRVRGLVYVDAAYDHARSGELHDLAPGPALQPPAAADLASTAAMIEWTRRERGYVIPVAELLSLYRFSADDRPLDVRASGTARGLFGDALESPAFAVVAAPTLALFCKPTLASLYPTYRDLSRADRDLARTRARVLRDWCRASIATFESLRPDAEVVALDGANHYVFLSEPEGTARRLREFLGKL